MWVNTYTKTHNIATPLLNPLRKQATCYVFGLLHRYQKISVVCYICFYSHTKRSNSRRYGLIIYTQKRSPGDNPPSYYNMLKYSVLVITRCLYLPEVGVLTSGRHLTMVHCPIGLKTSNFYDYVHYSWLGDRVDRCKTSLLLS